MTLSADGSLCLVADDSVHVYTTSDCQPGVRWPEACTLCQPKSTTQLHDLVLFSDAKSVQEGAVVVAARDHSHVYLWNLASSSPAAALVHEVPMGVSVTALCQLTANSILVALSDLSFVELSCDRRNLGSVRGSLKDAVTYAPLHMAALPGEEGRVAVVDASSGLRVLHVELTKSSLEEERFAGTGARAEVKGDSGPTALLSRYFNDMATGDADRSSGEAKSGDGKLSSVASAAQSAKAASWLKSVLHEPAYTAPSMGSVLSLYLKRRSGVN